MKTEKEINDRLEMHQDRVAQIEKSISEEKIRFFPNNKLIEFLEGLRLEENAAIVHLSWVLI